MTQKIIDKLIQKGVSIPNPQSVFISDDVDIDRISTSNVTLYNGTKLIGSRVLIMAGTQVGYEAPVTLENCLVGPNTKLHGGYFQDTVFMGDNVFGSNGHVRKGCILEEEANAAHTVGLKQTILFPFVTLGSLINFCDCLMAGGTSRKNHSEVGSSFIHFNYTPNQDKATASMMGNIPKGVMLNQAPVFLGGQGGLVGPVQIGFGCITAAGSIIRKSEPRQGRLLMGGAMKTASLSWREGVYTNPNRIFKHNIAYIAGLIALKNWYKNVRPLFIHDLHSGELVKGLQTNLTICIKERVKRLDAFGEKLKLSKQILSEAKKGQGSAALDSHDKVLEKIKKSTEVFEHEMENMTLNANGEKFVQAVDKMISSKGKAYVNVIQSLEDDTIALGSNWLADIENRITTTFEN
ncbi:MAG: protein GlmU [Desulfobacterales bacterium]|nr:protein GlmU [Desulfobacterales bacterium]